MKTISELIYLKLLNNLVEMLPEIFDEFVRFRQSVPLQPTWEQAEQPVFFYC